MEALEFLQGQEVDLIFLDINMPMLTGMQLAKLLPKRQRVIFTTAYTDYAVESYNVNAVDYLLKPITFERFITAVEKVSSMMKQMLDVNSLETGNFFVKVGKSMVKINYSNIYYIEGLKDYVVFRLEKEKHIVYKRMKELQENLPANFARVHQSFIVNMDHIKKIEDNHIHMLDKEISISGKFRDGFMQLIKNKLV